MITISPETAEILNNELKMMSSPFDKAFPQTSLDALIVALVRVEQQAMRHFRMLVMDRLHHLHLAQMPTTT